MTFFNPAISLLCALFYSVILSFSQFEYIFILPVLFVLYLNYKNIFDILKKLLTLNLFIFLLFISLLISSDLNSALNIYIRTNAIMLFNIGIFYTSNGYDLIKGLNMLKFPVKLISTMFFTIKMIEYLNNDVKNILNTLKTRGFKAKNSLFTYQTFGNIIGMLFIRAINKTQSLNDTFLSRSFNGNIYLINNYTIQKTDYILVFLIFLIFLYKDLL